MELQKDESILCSFLLGEEVMSNRVKVWKAFMKGGFRNESKSFLDFRKGEYVMITKRGKKMSGFWPNCKRLPLIFFFCIVVCLISTPSSTWAKYTYTEMLPPAGWSFAYPHAINNKGDVVGYGSTNGSIWTGFLCTGGTCTELTFPGWNWVNPQDIDDNGVVVGYGYDGHNVKAFLYSEGIYKELLPPGPPAWVLSVANAINDKGVVVGSGCDPHGCRMFLYSKGTYTELQLPPGWDPIYSPDVCDINNKGDIVGWGYDGSSEWAFLFSEGTYTELDPAWAKAFPDLHINDKGDIVGYGEETSKGFLYSDGIYKELLPPDSTWSYPIDFNKKGVVLIVGSGPSSYKTFLYSKGTYTEFVPPPGWTLVQAPYAINDKGDIVGYGYDVTNTLKLFIVTQKK